MPVPTEEHSRQQPYPALTPEQVLELQLRALQENHLPHDDCGIALAYSFASPANKAVTGSLARFTAMIKNPLYCDLLGCQRFSYQSLRSNGSVAQAIVTVLSAEYAEVVYMFVLTRQESGIYTGCWMTDSVVRLAEESL